MAEGLLGGYSAEPVDLNEERTYDEIIADERVVHVHPSQGVLEFEQAEAESQAQSVEGAAMRIAQPEANPRRTGSVPAMRTPQTYTEPHD